MATPAIAKLSYAELLKLEERIKSAIAARKAQDALTTKQELRAMAAKAGFNLDELFGSRRGPRKGSKATVKYRNPKDSFADVGGTRSHAALAGRCS